MGRDAGGGSFDNGKVYWVKGSTLNSMLEKIRLATPKPGRGTTISQTPDGTQIHADSAGITEPDLSGDTPNVPTIDIAVCFDGELRTLRVVGVLLD